MIFGSMLFKLGGGGVPIDNAVWQVQDIRAYPVLQIKTNAK